MSYKVEIQRYKNLNGPHRRNLKITENVEAKDKVLDLSQCLCVSPPLF